jgi:integrase
MANGKRIATKYPGVFFREVKRLSGDKGLEKVYYIVYKKDGKVHEEKAGRQFVDDMTAAKASAIRALKIEGRRPSRKEEREAKEAAEEAERKKVTIGKIWEDYQVIRASKKSLITDKYNYKNHLKQFSDKKPDELLTIDIQKFRVQLEHKGLSPASVKHCLVLLRMLINWGVRQGICPPPDPSKLRFDLPKLDNEQTEMLSEEQINSYISALDKEIDQNLASLFRLALVTGMRKNALLNLQWDDCDFENHVILLRGEVAKKGHTERIPMNEAAFSILNSIEKSSSPYIFPGRDGGPRKEIRRMAQRVKKRAGLPDNFRPLHGLRHAFASHLISSGKVSLYELQKLLTHSSPKMTQRYAHLADEALRKASEVASDIFKDSVK